MFDEEVARAVVSKRILDEVLFPTDSSQAKLCKLPHQKSSKLVMDEVCNDIQAGLQISMKELLTFDFEVRLRPRAFTP